LKIERLRVEPHLRLFIFYGFLALLCQTLSTLHFLMLLSLSYFSSTFFTSSSLSKKFSIMILNISLLKCIKLKGKHGMETAHNTALFLATQRFK